MYVDNLPLQKPTHRTMRDVPRLQRQIEQLTEDCEEADRLMASGERATKYRKDNEGKPVTSGYIGSLNQQVKESSKTLVSVCKAVRCFHTKGDK